MSSDTQASKPRKRHPKRLRCAICGSPEHVEFHHLGGKYHVAWMTVPLCRKHHVKLTEQIRVAGIDMGYTPDPHERRIRARQAAIVFLWMLDDAELDSINGRRG